MNRERTGEAVAAVVEQLLNQAGVAALNQLSPLDAVAAALLQIRCLAKETDPLTQGLLRSETLRTLKSARISGASHLVDIALPRSTTHARAAETKRATAVAEIEPWDETVELGSVLDELAEVVRRYVVLDRHEAAAVALWVVHTHCIGAADIAPRLAVLSPTKGCGKTTLLKVLADVVHKPLSAASITTAATFRLLDRDQPTLLIDEADTFLPHNEELRGILNSGHDRESCTVYRCESSERSFEPVPFRTYGPVAIGMIGRLPTTLADRSITVQLRRKTSQDRVEPFRRREAATLTPLARKCRRCAQDYESLLRELAAPDIEGLDARASDNWEPLFAIAQLAGPTWSERAICAARYLTQRARKQEREDDLAEKLLADIRDLVQTQRIPERVGMRQLCDLLAQIDDAPWATIEHGRRLTPHTLGKRLRGFQIEPKTIRGAANQVRKGYERSAFQDAFRRYLPVRPVTSVTQPELQEFEARPPRLHDATVTGQLPRQKPNDLLVVTDVTGSNAPTTAQPQDNGGAP